MAKIDANKLLSTIFGESTIHIDKYGSRTEQTKPNILQNVVAQAKALPTYLVEEFRNQLDPTYIRGFTPYDGMNPTPTPDQYATQTPQVMGEQYTPQQQDQYATPTPTVAPTPTPPPDELAQPYYQGINKVAEEYEIPQDIFYKMLRKESMGFMPEVISGEISSPKGALGIAQFMPETAAWWQNTHGRFDPLKPEEAIPAAGHYLQYLYKQFKSWPLALAAYNAGEGAVKAAGGVPPYPETEDYVASIIGGQ